MIIVLMKITPSLFFTYVKIAKSSALARIVCPFDEGCGGMRIFHTVSLHVKKPFVSNVIIKLSKKCLNRMEKTV